MKNLGASPELRTRGTFNAAVLGANDPSGVDISGLIAPDVIESTFTGVDAAPSTAGQSLGSTGTTIDVELGDVDGASDTIGVALGDVDRDLDIVAGNENQGNRVWTNNGGGVFSDSGQSLGSNHSNAVVLGDVDSDGDVDLVTGNAAQANRVWTNDGAGTFTDSGPAMSAPPAARRQAAARGPLGAPAARRHPAIRAPPAARSASGDKRGPWERRRLAGISREQTRRRIAATRFSHLRF